MASRGDGNHFRVAAVQVNEIEKKCKKPLDKSPNLCYNKYVSERDKSPLNISLVATKRRENLVANIFQKEVDTMTTSTNTTRKPTQRDRYAEIREILASAGRDDLVEFVDGRVAQLDKKNSAERKPTAKQVENAGIKSDILDWMEQGVLYACADVAKTCPACEGISTNRVSALLTQLGKDGLLTVTEDKRKHFYSLA